MTIDSPNQLIMTKMILHNFKSYQGTVQIGPFHPRFTSIVGPNGSGKSNVIDALLFVFGFKAKKLRQGKLSELIHYSKDFPDLNECSVEIHFMSGNKEFIVSRLVKKTARGESSNYYLDGIQKNYSEIQELLKGFGIDLDHKRFLILQGEVEQIALMKPKGNQEDGLLEYLEDIIGTAKYKELIEQASIEFDQSNVEYENEVQKYKIIQKDADNLKEKTNEAIEFIHWENQLNLLNHKILKKQEIIKKNNIEKSLEKIESIDSQLNETKEKKFLDKEKIESIESKIREKTSNLKILNQELAKLEKNEIQLKESLKLSNQKHQKLSKTIKQETNQQNEDSNWISNFEKDVQKQKNEIIQLESKLDFEKTKLTQIRTELQPKTMIYQQQIEEKQRELAPWLEKINAKTGDLQVLEGEFSLLNDKITLLKQDYENAILSEKETRKRLKDIELESNEKNDEILKLKQIKKTENLENNLLQLKQEYNDTKSKYLDIKETNHSSTVASKVYNSLMNQLEIKGICGRLGNLGTIDKKYDVAITTACGSLDSIVCETVESAQKCIKYLKDHNLGRATFLCLDKISARDSGLKNTPENTSRLVDLVKCDEKYRACFYHAVGDTLVANDIDQANRVAYGKIRYRVVTLNGQIIDKSGTLTGGGSKVQRGGMGSKPKPENISSSLIELETKMESLLQQINSLESKIESENDKINTSKQELSKIKNDLQKLGLERKSLLDSLVDCENSVKIAKENAKIPKSDLDRVDFLESQITGEKANLSELKSSCKNIEDDIESLQQTIMDIGGVKLRLQNAKVDSIQEQIETLRKHILSLTAEKKQRQKALDKSFDSIEKKKNEIQSLEQEMSHSKEEIEPCSTQIHHLKTEIKSIEAELEDFDEDLKAAKKEYQDSVKEANQIRALQVELAAQLKSLKQKVASNKDSLQKLQTDLVNLKLLSTG
jgi:structural maintenance of chromosome 4